MSLDGDDGFGHWLAGFIDGEGCFGIYPLVDRRKKSGGGWQCRFFLGLRRDDELILQEIVMRTNLGGIRQKNSQMARWEVNSKDDCLGLVALLDRYPLRAKKSADFAIWRRAVLAWINRVPGNRHTGPGDWTEFRNFAAELRAIRALPEVEAAA